MTWADDRASRQARKVQETVDTTALYQQTGCPSHWMFPLYKLIWIRDKEPEIFKKAHKFITAKEFILKRLIGEYIVDYSLAAGSGMLNTHTLKWDETALDLIGITTAQLSELSRPTKVFKKMDPELSAAIGVPSDTLFILGSSDAANSNLGAGAVHAWESTCMVGTSGAFRIISPKPILDPRARSWCYVADIDKWLVGGAINNGGVALSWLQDMLNSAFPKAAAEVKLNYGDLAQLAGRSDAGSEGLICLPLFAGERSPHWNLNARAMFFGLTLQHDARHMARALLEGVAFRMRSLSEVLCEISEDIRQVRASGGFTRSPLWVQIITDTLNRELAIPEWGETSSLGASFWAMLGAGALSSFEEIGKVVKIRETYQPNPQNAALYGRQFEIYKDLYAATSPYFEAVSDLTKESDKGSDS
jgi:gluconokinase